MENEAAPHEKLPMYERNMLEHDVAERVGGELSMSIEDILLEHHGALSELIDNDLTIVQRHTEDRMALVNELATALLEQHRGQHAA